MYFQFAKIHEMETNPTLKERTEFPFKPVYDTDTDWKYFYLQ